MAIPELALVGPVGGFAGRGQVRRRWRAASLASGWTRPQDWWAPEVDAVLEAVLGGSGSAPWPGPVAGSVMADLGRARAEAGVGLQEALDDLYALYRILPSGVPPADVLRHLAEAWVEVALSSYRSTTCEDPVSGLASAAYLRTRLAEVYREAERSGRSVPGSHALLVVRSRPPVCDGDPDAAPDGDRSVRRWGQMLHRLTLGDALRSAFSGGETFAALGPGVSVGLVVRDDALPRMVRGLIGELRRCQTNRRYGVWIEGLPRRLDSAYRLLGDLER